MLVTLQEILKDTREKRYAVGLFNCVTLEMTRGILLAAKELRSPVIIGPAQILLPPASLEDYCGTMLGMARRARVPVALHFDHGSTPIWWRIPSRWVFPRRCMTAACCPWRRISAARRIW